MRGKYPPRRPGSRSAWQDSKALTHATANIQNVAGLADVAQPSQGIGGFNPADVLCQANLGGKIEETRLIIHG